MLMYFLVNDTRGMVTKPVKRHIDRCNYFFSYFPFFSLFLVSATTNAGRCIYAISGNRGLGEPFEIKHFSVINIIIAYSIINNGKKA